MRIKHALIVKVAPLSLVLTMRIFYRLCSHSFQRSLQNVDNTLLSPVSQQGGSRVGYEVYWGLDCIVVGCIGSLIMETEVGLVPWLG
jgi:hypothetical protein